MTVIRTSHHVDDFSSQVLVDCQRQAIRQPDFVQVVSEYWRKLLAEQYGVTAGIVHNDVDAARFRTADPALRARLHVAAGAEGRPLLVAVGGIEPRKGSDTLVQALSQLTGVAPGPRDYSALRGHPARRPRSCSPPESITNDP